MDKNAIKKYAVWARRELITRVAGRAAKYGITEEDCVDIHADSVYGRVLSSTEKEQRKAFIEKVRAEGYEQAVEEVAYTWFNRFCALRYMEVNGYFPSHIRVFTNDAGEFKPQILDEAIHLELPGLDQEKVFTLKDANETEELYRYLLITQCNALNAILPGMFQKIADYTELLLPENLLREGSVSEKLITEIPEEDWTDQVQIIGWLYQYYNAEKKDEVFSALKKNIKITKENIPAATQLFTPDWIVRYMVENSLGRLWVEGHPNEGLKSGWKYFLEEAEQEPEVEEQMAEIRKEYAALRPEEIKCIDPCCGSGHVLVYMFDVLMQIYESLGYTTQEAVCSILENNLYGLDIDERAAQLAYFAVMMKARNYDRRFFDCYIQPHVYAIYESSSVENELLELYGPYSDTAKKLLNAFADAKEYGSLINPDVTMEDLHALEKHMGKMDAMSEYGSLNSELFTYMALKAVWPFLEISKILIQKYNIVVTNPPYMGSGMSGKLNDFVKRNYPDSKSDLFAVFIERCGQMIGENGYQAMITQHAWMFLSSYQKLRGKLLQHNLINMAHLGARAFDDIGGEVVQTTSFVFCKTQIEKYKGTYFRLIGPASQQGKEDMFLAEENRFVAQQRNFSKIPGSPVAYWASENIIKDYEMGSLIKEIDEPKSGLSTTDNSRFLRFWYEVAFQKISFDIQDVMETIAGLKWFPIAKGGKYRKWYGNNEYVVNWENNGAEIKYATKNSTGGRIVSQEYYFKTFITWSGISSGEPSMRISKNAIFGSGAKALIASDSLYEYLALLNSKVALKFLLILSPTLNYEAGHIGNVPICFTEIDGISDTIQENINLSKLDWDSFEISWGFKRHPLI